MDSILTRVIEHRDGKYKATRTRDSNGYCSIELLDVEANRIVVDTTNEGEHHSYEQELRDMIACLEVVLDNPCNLPKLPMDDAKFK